MNKMKIELDGNLFQPHDKKIWIYALDSQCIGVSIRFITPWSKPCLFKARIPYQRIGNKIVFYLPQSLFHFYRFVQGNIKLVDSYSQGADTVLLSLETK